MLLFNFSRFERALGREPASVFDSSLIFLPFFIKYNVDWCAEKFQVGVIINFFLLNPFFHPEILRRLTPRLHSQSRMKGFISRLEKLMEKLCLFMNDSTPLSSRHMLS